jgi:DivIVA domain-containing protein
MELQLKRLLEQAKFTPRKGGYAQAEVDDFLDRASAMAAKVEAELTQALEQAKAGGGTSPEEVEAEIERRVAERVASQASDGAAEEAAAEEAHRTLLLAQRTADAAVREAREDAEKMRAHATEHAETVTADADAAAAKTIADAEAKAAELVSGAEARAARLQADAEAQAIAERRDARQRLASEIAELEGARESLRSDVTLLERHVEEQRSQLSSTISELHRLLDDPSGFRLAPAPALAEPQLPDFSDLDEPEAVAEPEPAAEETDTEAEVPAGAADDAGLTQGAAPEAVEKVEHAEPEHVESEHVEAVVEPTVEPIADPGPFAAPPASAEAATEAAPVADVVVIDSDEPAPPAPEASAGAVPQAMLFEAVDHEAPDVRIDEVETGPATAPVAAVDLGVEEPAPASAANAATDDDAFLAELRKAMADDEPLGPRDHDQAAHHGDFLDEDRRGWRFGRRR